MRKFFKSKFTTGPDYKQEYAKLQHLVTSSLDVIRRLEDQINEGGNKYRSYSEKVTALSRMYDGSAVWGNQLTKALINIRSYFIMGAGVSFGVEELKSVNTKKFMNDFIKLNHLEQRSPLEWAKEAQIEGKILLQLIPDKEYVNKQNTSTGNIKVKYIPWTVYQYEVESDPKDYNQFTRVTWDTAKYGKGNLTAGEFVYIPFGGRSYQVNKTPPMLSACIRELETIDKAFFDWRKIDHLFAAPTPFIKAETSSKAESIYQKLKDATWKVGKLLVVEGDLSLVGPEMQGVEWLKHEIVACIQLVSAISGVPVHFLGFPELIGAGRATADSMMESIQAATSTERSLWNDGMEELLTKAAIMASEQLNRGLLEASDINISIPFLSQQHLQELVDVWFPLYEGGVISLKTLHSKIPEINSSEEQKNLDKAKQETLKLLNESNVKEEDDEKDE